MPIFRTPNDKFLSANSKTVTLQDSPHIVSECRSADSADINDKIIRFSAVQMSKILDNSRNPKVLLRENADLLILLISTINIQHFLLFEC